MTELYLDGACPHVLVQPVALFSILDHYMRRNEPQQRVIGTLLGNISGSKIEVSNCFPMPHQETDEQVALEIDFHKTMSDLHRRMNPKEIIVGWYATGHDITEHSNLIHDFFARQTEGRDPIHLVVDTTLKTGRLNISAVISAPMGVPKSKAIGIMFTPIRCEVFYHESERLAVDLLSKAHTLENPTGALVSDLDHVDDATRSLQTMLNKCLQYVNQVVNGEIQGDPTIGRFLLDTVSAVPKIDAKQFERMFNNVVQDLLMVTYLSNLARTQVLHQEKLLQDKCPQREKATTNS